MTDEMTEVEIDTKRILIQALQELNLKVEALKARVIQLEHAAAIHSDKGYQLGSLADADAFAEKRRRANDIGDCV
jgi:hypothetical protein